MAYGNDNLMFVRDCQYVTTGAASETVTLDKETKAITLYAVTEGAWVNVGTAPTAAAPGAEKTASESFFVPAGLFFDIAVPVGTDSAPIKVAAIQSSSGGTLYIYQRQDV